MSEEYFERPTVGEVAKAMLVNQLQLMKDGLMHAQALRLVESSLCHDDQVDYLERRIRYFGSKVERLTKMVAEAEAGG